MRDRDPSIDFDDLPEIQAEQRDNFRPKPAAATATRKKPARAAASASVAARPAVSGMVYAVLGLIIAALAFLAFQLYAQATKLDARVQELENRLSTTDESLSQSGVAMQLAIQELKGRVGEQQTEVDKLWNSAWKKNQAQLAEQSKKLEALSQGHKQLSARFTEELGNLQKTSTAHAADMKVVMARTETLAAMDAGIKEQAKSLATLKQQLATMESRNTALSRKIDENAGWIESNNAFRQQTNQSLNRLEQQVRKLQPTSTTIITP